MHLDSLPITTVPVPAGPFSPQIAELQIFLGQLNAEITHAICDGVLTMTRRNQLVIRLRGLAREADDLADRMEIPALDETKA